MTDRLVVRHPLTREQAALFAEPRPLSVNIQVAGTKRQPLLVLRVTWPELTEQREQQEALNLIRFGSTHPDLTAAPPGAGDPQSSEPWPRHLSPWPTE